MTFEQQLQRAYDRGRSYVRHLEQLSAGKRGAQVVCPGCALDSELTRRPKAPA